MGVYGCNPYGFIPAGGGAGGGGGSGNPGGVDGDFQWNDNGNFAGVGNYDSETGNSTLPGDLSATSFNSVALTTAGSGLSFLSDNGTYLTPSAIDNIFSKETPVGTSATLLTMPPTAALSLEWDTTLMYPYFLLTSGVSQWDLQLWSCWNKVADQDYPINHYLNVVDAGDAAKIPFNTSGVGGDGPLLTAPGDRIQVVCYFKQQSINTFVWSIQFDIQYVNFGLADNRIMCLGKYDQLV